MTSHLSNPEPTPNAGQTWAHRVTGDRVVLAGRKTLAWVLRGPDGHYEIPVEDLGETYAWVGCDHVDHCCPAHAVHVTPHRGCLLR